MTLVGLVALMLGPASALAAQEIDIAECLPGPQSSFTLDFDNSFFPLRPTE